MDDKLLQKIALYGIGALIAWKVLRAMQVKLGNVGTQVSTSLIDVFHRPGGTVNTAAQHDTELQSAIKAIINANPQYTPHLIQRFLVSRQWRLGQPLPAGGLNLKTPPGM